MEDNNAVRTEKTQDEKEAEVEIKAAVGPIDPKTLQLQEVDKNKSVVKINVNPEKLMAAKILRKDKLKEEEIDEEEKKKKKKKEQQEIEDIGNMSI